MPEAQSSKRTSSPPTPVLLVVDDQTDNREIYADYFRIQGWEAKEAVDGAEGIEVAVQVRPTAIVMDLAMPVVDGWEATRRLKSDARTRDIPVIVVTGNADRNSDVEARSREIGCAAYLTKPCLPSDLFQAVVDVVSKARRGGG